MARILAGALALLMLGCAVPEDPEAGAPDLPAPAVSTADPEGARPPLDPGTPPTWTPAAADLSPLEQAVGERMRAVGEVTVEVEMLAEGSVVGHGSGVFVSPEGHVLTALHVVENKTQQFRVVRPDGQARAATVVARDQVHDAALLVAPGPATPFARMRARPPANGEWIVCAGYGGSLEGDRVPMRSAGVVVESGYAWSVTEYTYHWRFREPVKTETFWNMLRLDCASASGMSGGPVVDVDGNLLGVVVGTGATAASISAIGYLLPKAARPAGVEPAASIPKAARDAEGHPSRAVTMEPMLAKMGAERSVIELVASGSARGGQRFPAVIVSSDGLVVAPSVRITRTGEPDGTVPPEDIHVAGHPDARCSAILAVRGELALLQFADLVPSEQGAVADLAPLPVGETSAATVGQIVSVVGAGGARGSLGFVTGLGRSPGMVAPDAPRGGCGSSHRWFRENWPEVQVTSALAHDAGRPAFGSLLVDRAGHPVAIEVASRATGLSYAIAWPEITTRFAEWLRVPSE